MLFYFQAAGSNYMQIFLPKEAIGCNGTALLVLSLTMVVVIIFSIRKLKMNTKSDSCIKLDENKGTKKFFESQII